MGKKNDLRTPSPLGDRVVIELSPPEDRLPGSQIFLAASANPRKNQGKVVAVGPSVSDAVAKDAVVLFDADEAFAIDYGDLKLVIVSEENLLAVL